MAIPLGKLTRLFVVMLPILGCNGMITSILSPRDLILWRELSKVTEYTFKNWSPGRASACFAFIIIFRL